jgi:uncharacterized protein GlcG (DUF336 family)
VTVLSLEVALSIAQNALAEGRKRGFLPLTAAVLDAGGHVVALLRSDGSSLLRPQIATAKAWGALGLGFGSREIALRSTKVPVFINALIELSGGNMVPVAGGVLIRDQSKAIIGAVGITGDTSDNDEACAVEAIKAAGLTADTGA